MTTDNSEFRGRPQTGPLAVAENVTDTAALLVARGVLDSRTYLQLRDSIVQAALTRPRAVLVDVDNLEVPEPSAWTALSSAHWLVSTWPAIPIHLVSARQSQRAAIIRTGVTRHVPLHRTVRAALDALPCTAPAGARACATLPAALASLRAAREFVARSLSQWAMEDLVPVATVVVNVFVENVLQHTTAEPALTLDTDGTTVTVAVQDDCTQSAVRYEDLIRSGEWISGLAIVASVSRAWGSAPTGSGKTVWATIGPENRL